MRGFRPFLVRLPSGDRYWTVVDASYRGQSPDSTSPPRSRHHRESTRSSWRCSPAPTGPRPTPAPKAHRACRGRAKYARPRVGPRRNTERYAHAVVPDPGPGPAAVEDRRLAAERGREALDAH